MSRILLLADAGSSTGFARVSHSVGDRLVRDYGHDIHCLAVNYDGDSVDTLMKLYLPTKLRSNDVYGQSRFVEMLGKVMPDVTIMINDPYVILKFLFRNQFDPQAMLARTRPIIAYMPVDGTNQPPAWSGIGALMKDVPPTVGGKGPYFVPVAMTRFGGRFFGTDDVIYHGIDTERYAPLSEHPVITSAGQAVTSQEQAKAILGLPPRCFLVLRVDRNSHRKNFGDTWRALVPVMKAHKDVYAWLHCRVEGDQLELPQVISREPDIADRFRYPGGYDTKKGWPEADMAVLYAAADVFVSTSWGEGFGLTLGEAAAAGVPIVAQNVSSIPEVVGPGGILLEPERLTAVESGQDQWLPDVAKFTYAIEKLYGSRKLRQSLGEAGRKHVVTSFSWDVAASQFHELITRVAQEAPETYTREDEDASQPAEDQQEEDLEPPAGTDAREL